MTKQVQVLANWACFIIFLQITIYLLSSSMIFLL